MGWPMAYLILQTAITQVIMDLLNQDPPTTAVEVQVRAEKTAALIMCIFNAENWEHCQSNPGEYMQNVKKPEIPHGLLAQARYTQEQVKLLDGMMLGAAFAMSQDDMREAAAVIAGMATTLRVISDDLYRALNNNDSYRSLNT